jgi:hypothetical protein
MIRIFARLGALAALLAASPALAISDPFSRGPLAAFLNIFSQQAIPRQVVTWPAGLAPAAEERFESP